VEAEAMDIMFERACEQVRDGEISGNDFIARTRDVWARLAVYVLRKWRAPAWFGQEDVEHQLMMSGWKHVWMYEPARAKGVTIGRYVVWNAVSEAKKELHKMRAAKRHRRADSAPSRFDLPLSALVGEDSSVDELLDAIASVKPDQEDAVERAWAMKRALDACETPTERQVIRALGETGDFVDGAAYLYEDKKRRRALGLKSKSHASTVTVRAAMTVARRLVQQSVAA
jgi:hypothetical protein